MHINHEIEEISDSKKTIKRTIQRYYRASERLVIIIKKRPSHKTGYNQTSGKSASLSGVIALALSSFGQVPCNRLVERWTFIGRFLNRPLRKLA
ncbi:MAG: hypothetical protein ACJAXI_000143 [Crocinitomicaceae bacterium]|jgi:hypothetical protein